MKKSGVGEGVTTPLSADRRTRKNHNQAPYGAKRYFATLGGRQTVQPCPVVSGMYANNCTHMATARIGSSVK